jgi:PH (Pleckstrin Homology) domain-containing protein
VDDSAATSVAEFFPDRRYTVLAGIGALGAALAAALSDDPPGRILLTLAGIVLLGYVAADLIFRPRLAASPAGIVVNSPFNRVSLSWSEVTAVRAETRFRRGLRNVTLEIDAGAVLAVFTRRTLGVEPDEAAARIETIRSRSGA